MTRSEDFSNVSDAKPSHQYVVLFFELGYYERTLDQTFLKFSELVFNYHWFHRWKMDRFFDELP